MSDIPSTPNKAGRRLPGGLFVALVALALLSVLLMWRGDRSPEKSVGQKLAALDLTCFSGQGGSPTLADLRGKVVLVNFWATWCPYCLDELPILDRLRKEFEASGDFVLLPVSCDDDVPKVLRYKIDEVLRQRKLDLPVYVDRTGTTRGAFRELAGATGFPTTFVLDRRGVVRAVWVGYGPKLEDEMRDAIQKLLDEAP
jgi:thiol-disulfide isomerase/thioredoxin